MSEVRTAVIGDLRYIVSLMRANRESVGGLPEPAIRERIERGTALIAFVDGDPVGYILFDVRSGVARVPQACIQYDARRRKYGVALVAAFRQRVAAAQEIVVRCAADLEANVFWRDMGFVCVGSVAGGKRRGRTINVWAMWSAPRLVSLADVEVRPAAELRRDSMYDDSGFLQASPDGFRVATVLPKIAWANQRTHRQLDLELR